MIFDSGLIYAAHPMDTNMLDARWGAADNGIGNRAFVVLLKVPDHEPLLPVVVN